MTHELTVTMPVSPCPHCGLPIDPRAWQEHGRGPEAGDLTICQGCAHVLRFDKLLRLTAMTERDERRLLALNPDILQQARTVARRLPADLPRHLPRP